MPSPATRVWLLALPLATVLLAPTAANVSALQAPTATCAQVWLTRPADFESFLRTADVVTLKDVPVGVTRPSRAFLKPGGLADSMAWKPIPPGIKSGYWESYKSEIAAYELDKLLALQMIPPTVEREVRGDTGAAVLWVAPARSFKDLGGVPGQGRVGAPPPAAVVAWNRQIVRAKMFDNLIANKDPNLGNWLVDEDWHLFLIDHSRSFTTMKTMVHKMEKFDRELWERFRVLDEASLIAAVGQWLGRGEIRALLERRDRMRQEIDKLVATRGDTVFVP
jgi:hypothetical protein